jgi:hypothetical protein
MRFVLIGRILCFVLHKVRCIRSPLANSDLTRGMGIDATRPETINPEYRTSNVQHPKRELVSAGRNVLPFAL